MHKGIMLGIFPQNSGILMCYRMLYNTCTEAKYELSDHTTEAFIEYKVFQELPVLTFYT